MKKIFLIILFIFSFLKSDKFVFAEKIAGQSAIISYNFNYNVNTNNHIFNQDLLIKQQTIKKILSDYQSPLVSEAYTFVKTCQMYNIDCYLMPAITGLESGFGHYILPNSYNPFGWGGGYIIFESWTEAIEKVGQSLRYNYYNHGANTIEKIGPIYAESRTWSQRVNYFRNLFLEEEKNQKNLYILENNIK